jgi:hypothetical protein
MSAADLPAGWEYTGTLFDQPEPTKAKPLTRVFRVSVDITLHEHWLYDPSREGAWEEEAIEAARDVFEESRWSDTSLAAIKVDEVFADDPFPTCACTCSCGVVVARHGLKCVLCNHGSHLTGSENNDPVINVVAP